MDIRHKAKDNQPTVHNPEKTGNKENLKRDICGSPKEREVVKLSLVMWQHRETGEWGGKKGSREENMKDQED